MEIRLARTDELDLAGEITQAAYSAFTSGPADPYVAKLRDAATRAAEAELYVAEDGGALLGNVTWCPRGSAWREISQPDEGEFRMLAVAPGAQGQGVGEALARFCLEMSRAAGDRGVVISSMEQMAAAHRLYRRLGFTRLPERDWSPAPGVQLIAFELHHG